MKSESYDNFWQCIHKSAKDKGFPLRVMFELTYQCNFKCKHCYVPQNYRKKREIKTKEIFFILDQLADIGCFYLGFTGGEPFVRKDILQILWYAKKKGFEIIIYTNGSLIDKNIAAELASLRPNKVDITIPAISKSAFEKISGVSGSRDKVFKAIELLYKKKVDLGFKTCVLKENESEIKEIQDFAASLGALHRLDDMLSRRLDGSDEPFRYRGVLRHSEAVPLNVEKRRPKNPLKRFFVAGAPQNDNGYRNQDDSGYGVQDGCDKKTVDYGLSTPDLFRCGVGLSQAAITPLGELKMCLMIDYPKTLISANLTRMNANLLTRIHANEYSRGLALKDAWDKLKELVASVKPDQNYKCNQCGLQAYCKWCPARGWLENRSFTSCEPESRRWAERRAGLNLPC